MQILHLSALFAVLLAGGVALLMPGEPPPVPGLDAAQLARFASLNASNAPAGRADPYVFYAAHPTELLPPPPSHVCGLRFVDDAKTTYALEDFKSPAAAEAAGARVTHYGRCGTCSTLQDLAVYLGRPDLTAPVRKCGLLSPVRPLAMTCLRKLGFSEACARTWYANMRNTARVCLSVCMRSWIAGEASNTDGRKLNTCLECDEVRSGPVFKREAGRTRRNSGIVSSIARDDAEVAAVQHDY
ncbi:hypothetical protein DFJ74DRAFT_424336 [Hyaloraphidium curvatum]|nr:hypothetical protein DFJ74DRAFT_424336 [Hyaloraphidium curvatum]